MSSRFGRRIGSALVVLVALLLPLAGLEIFLRIKGVDTRSWTRPDPVIGWSSIPGARYVNVPAEKCAGWGSSGRMNSHGLRDREIPYEKPPGTIRILALGDSFTEAFQFAIERTWTKLLEEELNARGDGRRYEVINAGRSGMATTHEWLFFSREGKKYDPDIVLLLFIVNDFQENSKKLALATAYGPYLAPAPGGGFALDTSFRESRDYRMRTWMTPWKRASFVVSAALDRYSVFRASNAAKRQAKARGEETGTIDVAGRRGLGPSWVEEDFLWVEKPTPEWREAAAITQEALRRLDHEVDAIGARLVVINGTSRIQVRASEVDRVAMEHPGWNLDRPQSYVAEVATRESFDFFDLVPEFRAFSATEDVLLHGCLENGGEGHWSAEAHRLAAERIAGHLASGPLRDSEAR